MEQVDQDEDIHQIELDMEEEEKEQKPSFWSKFMCCFKKPVIEEVRYEESPDRDFHADKIIKLTDGYTAYKLIEPKSTNSPTPPLIILLHGMFNSSYMWADVAELLADFAQGPQAQVLLLDFYGHGRSPWDGRNLSLDCLVTQVRELMDGKFFY
jgi:pimeloyl-ACP methyl ester carboxylesterase